MIYFLFLIILNSIYLLCKYYSSPLNRQFIVTLCTLKLTAWNIFSELCVQLFTHVIFVFH